MSLMRSTSTPNCRFIQTKSCRFWVNYLPLVDLTIPMCRIPSTFLVNFKDYKTIVFRKITVSYKPALYHFEMTFLRIIIPFRPSAPSWFTNHDKSSNDKECSNTIPLNCNRFCWPRNWRSSIWFRFYCNRTTKNKSNFSWLVMTRMQKKSML